jgi:predicted dehydrogenase
MTIDPTSSAFVASGQPLATVARVLVVGLGSIGARHLRIARSLFPEAEFAALRSTRDAPPANFPVETLKTFFSIDDAIVFAPTVAVIATPAPFHAATAIRLADAGVHLLIEKPLADTLKSCLAIEAAEARSGVVVMVGYNLRFLPSLQVLRAAVDDGRLGRILSVRAEVGQYLPDWRPGRDYRHSVSAQLALGGGALLELSHEIDYLTWIFGDVVEVSALLQQTGSLGIDVEDCVHLTLRFNDRDFRRGLVANVSLDFVRRDPVRRCVVIGECGTLEWDAVLSTVRHFDGVSSTWQVLFDSPNERDATYREEWLDFCTCIANHGKPRVDTSAGVTVSRIVDAARRSDMTGCRVALALDPAGTDREE